MQKSYGVSKVQKSDIYPIYQLWMYDSGNLIAGEDKLKIAILTTYAWLREKVASAGDSFESLDFPDSSHYQEVKLSDFHSLSIRQGYEIETVCIPDEGVFIASFTEWDQETLWSEKDQSYEHYAGRKVTTEFSYRLLQQKLEVAVKVIFSDSCNVDAYSTPKRPSIVKRLVENELLSFRQTGEINKEYTYIKDKQGVDLLKEYLGKKENGLNMIVICEKDYNAKDTGDVGDVLLTGSSYIELFRELMKRDMRKSEKEEFVIPKINFKEEDSEDDQLRIKIINETKEDKFTLDEGEEVKPDIRLPIKQYDGFARSGYGYAMFYALKLNLVDVFNKVFGVNLKPGEGVVLTPDNFGGSITILSNEVLEGIEGTFYDTDFGKTIRDYSRRRVGYYFGNTLSLEGAKVTFRDKLYSLNASMKLSAEESERKVQEVKDYYEAEKADLNIQINNLRKTIKLRDDTIKNKQEEINHLVSQKNQNLDEFYQQMAEYKKIIDYWKHRTERPKDTNEIPDWVEKEFSGRLILHKKAIDKILAVNKGEISMDIVLDGLEYLACEYRDYRLLKTIDEDTHNRLCSQKYGRVFEVTPCGWASQTMPSLSADYKIKYASKGNKETMLDMHLKYGNKSPDLVRIYFAIDVDKDNLIVVGSLPNHLATRMNKT
ncbi:MAG: hypothetical protein HUJ56_02710 [Erysipelotrichaceae bacterium]|nr:hypothetical protein [Erysipelotrichaceae bacterium]